MKKDKASNLISKQTANLFADSDKKISYDYEYSRIKSISYPNDPGNNVTYSYGAPGASFNRAGRIVSVNDASGSVEMFYGQLGEVVKENRRVVYGNIDKTYTTEYEFDNWGRLHKMIYPDGEVLTYTYDTGGLLESASGAKGGVNTAYIGGMFYDKFGQRKFMDKGSMTQTYYDYDPLNRRLKRVATSKGGWGQTTFQDLSYEFDENDNVTRVQNKAPVLNNKGAVLNAITTTQTYTYDDLNRLVTANGVYNRTDGKRQEYQLAMSYDEIHNITSKTQNHDLYSSRGSVTNQTATTYDFSYSYGGSQPHAPTQIGTRSYGYDFNGNQTGFTDSSNNFTRTIEWDEENRIKRITDGGSVKGVYKYDHSGQRIIKDANGNVSQYVNQFFTVKGSAETKHVFAGKTRIASKMDNGGNKDNFLYYFHPDHLGSTQYVTDEAGEIYEHMEYFPFGETWVEDNGQSEKVKYLFTSKELDSETQLYYMSARYYDPRTSVWQSVDPILGDYLNGKTNGGVFYPFNISMYTYTFNNPLRYIDPTGAAGLEIKQCRKITFKEKIEIIRAAEQVRRNMAYSTSPVMFAIDNPHTALDAAGMSPGIGIIFDAANAIYYLVEGDYGNAALSGISAIPVYGIGGTIVRWMKSNDVLRLIKLGKIPHATRRTALRLIKGALGITSGQVPTVVSMSYKGAVKGGQKYREYWYKVKDGIWARIQEHGLGH
ncbi:MAG: hypothetical protein OEZ36_03430, partial [Spirochaetota bacterium]|nr:hypothetical protein [Spirochaetota bacterium]